MGALPTQTWCISTSSTPLPWQKYSAQQEKKTKQKKQSVPWHDNREVFLATWLKCKFVMIA